MSEQKTLDSAKPTEKQVDFMNKLLKDDLLSKTDYSYIINFTNSIIFNRKQYLEKKN